jgi:hypothetical protein
VEPKAQRRSRVVESMMMFICNTFGGGWHWSFPSGTVQCNDPLWFFYIIGLVVLIGWILPALLGGRGESDESATYYPDDDDDGRKPPTRPTDPVPPSSPKVSRERDVHALADAVIKRKQTNREAVDARRR